jgi:hypothetical protein
MFDEMLDFLEPILDDFLNLLLLEADPRILSSQDRSLCVAPSTLLDLSGVD